MKKKLTLAFQKASPTHRKLLSATGVKTSRVGAKPHGNSSVDWESRRMWAAPGVGRSMKTRKTGWENASTRSGMASLLPVLGVDSKEKPPPLCQFMQRWKRQTNCGSFIRSDQTTSGY